MPPWKRPGFRRNYFGTGEAICFQGSGVPVHDAAFKKMFSHPLMIELLVRSHVPEWGERIDYSTLEQLPPELVSESLQRRYPDMMWRARTGDGESDLLIMLEFQARPDRFMALRTTTYACLALEGLAERKALGPDGQLPEVMSLVLHHGDRPWNAPVRLAELFGRSSPGVYRLVGRRSAGELAAPSPSDLPSMALGLARERTLEEMRPQLGALRRATEACSDEDFDQFMGGCVRAMLVSRGFSAEQLEEAMTMGSVMTAFERGMEELVSRGRVEGQARMLRQMAARKFSSETAEELSHLLARNSDPEHFDQVARAILECGSSEEFIAQVREI